MFLQRCLVRMSLLVAASTWTEILRVPEEDIVVLKKCDCFWRKSIIFWTYWWKSHIFSSLNTSSRIVFKWRGNNFLLDLFLSDGRKTERELERGKGIEWRDLTTLCYDLTGWLPWCKSREKHYRKGACWCVRYNPRQRFWPLQFVN